jgi:hypothetical protein
MKISIKKELAQHILDKISDRIIDNSNKDDWHYYCFNEDSYIVYHSKGLEWLKRHDINAFEAIDTVREYEVDNFWKMHTQINPQHIVDVLVYIYGEELIYSIKADTVEQLETELKEIVSETKFNLIK